MNVAQSPVAVKIKRSVSVSVSVSVQSGILERLMSITVVRPQDTFLGWTDLCTSRPECPYHSNLNLTMFMFISFHHTPII